MKIKKVVMRKMYQDMKVGFRTSFGVTTRKHFSMIEIHTDDGVGYGDCSAFERPWYNEETRDGAFDIIRKFLVPTLFEFGDVPSPEAFYDATSWIRRNKMARAAVDCALWDLYAQDAVYPADSAQDLLRFFRLRINIYAASYYGASTDEFYQIAYSVGCVAAQVRVYAFFIS